MPYTSIDPELQRNIPLNNPRSLLPLPLLLPRLLLIMFLKMRNILRMNQILLLHIIPTMIFLPMMNFILVLIIAMMSRSVAEIRKLDALRGQRHEFVASNGAGMIRVEQLQDFLDDLVFLDLGDVRGGLVFQAVGAFDVARGPDALRIIVV